MSQTPELYWKVKIEEANKPVRFDFVTKQQATSRGLIGQVLLAGQDNAYVKENPVTEPRTFTPYAQWKRKRR